MGNADREPVRANPTQTTLAPAEGCLQPRLFTAEIACLRLPVDFATQTGADPHRQAEIAEPDHGTTGLRDNGLW